jgi:glycosyl transferase family 2
MIQVPVDLPVGVVAVPTGMLARFNEFWDSMMRLQIPAGDGGAYARYASPSIATNRNMPVRHMLTEAPEARWVAYWDDDHSFTPDILIKRLHLMLKHPELGAIGSLYVAKVPPFPPVAFRTVRFDGRGTTGDRFTWEQIAEARQRTPLLTVAGCGGGGLLVRREVFEKIPDPWFTVGRDPEIGSNDDIEFCQKVIEAGFRVAVDIAQPITHLTPCGLRPEWDPERQAWYVGFTFEGLGFRLPVELLARTEPKT